MVKRVALPYDIKPEDFKADWWNSKSGTCVILANGPSLQSREELARIPYYKIGLERAFLATSELDCLMMVDPRIIKEHLSTFAEMTKKAEIRMTSRPVPHAIVPKILKWADCRAIGYTFSTDPVNKGFIRACGMSMAVQLAYYLGFRKIIFCGLDLHLKNGAHFYKQDRPCEIQMLESQVEWLKMAKPMMDMLGLSLISTTLDSAEKTTEKIPFDEIF